MPVHGVGFSRRRDGDLDLAVRKPQAPQRVMVHNEVTIEVPVAKKGQAGSRGDGHR